MKFLLTSSGIRNPSIHNALVNLLGKPIAECSALIIPTAIYPFPGGPAMAYRFLSGATANRMVELGWKSLGVLELTALPSIKAEYWIAAVQAADALLVYGGDVLYLCRWMRESGMADLLPSLRETVYVGVSAGSMVTAPIFGETYDDPNTPFVIDKGLGLVDFALLPHLDHKDHPESSTAKVERMAAEVPVPMYAIDDETAIRVTDGSRRRLRGPLEAVYALIRNCLKKHGIKEPPILGNIKPVNKWLIGRHQRQVFRAAWLRAASRPAPRQSPRPSASTPATCAGAYANRWAHTFCRRELWHGRRWRKSNRGKGLEANNMQGDV